MGWKVVAQKKDGGVGGRGRERERERKEKNP